MVKNFYDFYDWLPLFHMYPLFILMALAFEEERGLEYQPYSALSTSVVYLHTYTYKTNKRLN